MSWIANIGAQVLLDPKSATKYVCKYIRKPERGSNLLKEIQTSIIPKLTSKKPVVLFIYKLLNRLSRERNIFT